MSTGFWRHRRLLIGLAIVAVSIGIVFASIPFLPTSPPPHTTVLSTKTVTVNPETAQKPGYNFLTVSLSANQNFWVEVNVTGGASSFCVIQDQPYRAWSTAYMNNNYYPLTSSICLLGPTQQESQDTLKFIATSSTTWWILALNSNSSPITVSFMQA